MMMPDYLFEASWEVCNKVGGIHTVLATKAESLAKELKDKHIGLNVFDTTNYIYNNDLWSLAFLSSLFQCI